MPPADGGRSTAAPLPADGYLETADERGWTRMKTWQLPTGDYRLPIVSPADGCFGTTELHG